MKPLMLSIEGINSFTTKQVIDFATLSQDNIFGISGQTGSGKTTILDCILLALYQKGDRNNTLNEYINLKMDRAEIDFVFELEGIEYESIRVLSRQQSKNSIKLIDKTHGLVIGEKADEVFPFLEEKIGIGLDEFTSVVILEQGKFDKFLKATKKERNTILKKIFSLEKYDKLQTKFGIIAKDLESDLREVNAHLEEYEDVTLANIDELKKQEKELSKILDEKKKELLKLEKDKLIQSQLQDKYLSFCKITNLIAEKKSLLNSYTSSNKVLLENKKSLQAREIKSKQLLVDKEVLNQKKDKFTESKGLLEEINQDEIKLNEFRGQFKSLKQEKEEFDKKLAEQNEKINSIMTLLDDLSNATKIKAIDQDLYNTKNALLNQKNYRQNIEKLSKKLLEYKNNHTKQMNLLDIYTVKNKDIVSSQTKCNELLANAKDSLEKARKNNALSSVVENLKVGDVCPICGDTLTFIPRISNVSISEYQNKYDEFSRQREDLIIQLNKNQELTNRAKEEISKINENIIEIGKDIDSEKDKIVVFALPDEVMLEKIEMMLENLSIINTYKEKKVEIEKEFERANHNIELKTSEGKAKSALIEQKKDMVNKKIGNLSLTECDEQLNDIVKNIKVIDDELEKFENDKKTLDEKINQSNNNISTLSGEINQLTLSVKDYPTTDNSAVREKIEENILSIKQENEQNLQLLTTVTDKIKVLTEKLDKKREYSSQKKEISHKFDNADKLRKLFTGDSFIEFLATEYIYRFTKTASIKLQELSGGKYTLDYCDGEFYVFDFLNNNEKRKVRSLSGGETFLASLSIAVAISSELSLSKSYDFFFLDEGFGTLHSDALDTVANALYTLSRDTIVGIVTHSEELLDKLPVKLFVQSATSSEGTKVRIG